MSCASPSPVLHCLHMSHTPITRVVILHGYGVTPAQMWFPWLHAKVESAGAAAFVPALPDPLHPDLGRWLKAVAPYARTWGKETMIIGHSAGGVLALRAIEKLVKGSVGPVILISSPFAATISVKPYTSFFEKPIDWKLLKKKASSYTVFHAKNDPLVPFDHVLRYAEALDAKRVMLSKGGHLIGKRLPALGRALADALAAQ